MGALMASTIGCAAMMSPPPQVHMRFSPTSPTHLETVTKMAVVISGPVATGVPAEQGRTTRALRQVFDVERADDEDAFVVRYSVNGQKAPYTVWLSSAAVLLRVTEDSVVRPAASNDLIPDANDLAKLIGVPDG